MRLSDSVLNISLGVVAIDLPQADHEDSKPKKKKRLLHFKKDDVSGTSLLLVCNISYYSPSDFNFHGCVFIFDFADFREISVLFQEVEVDGEPNRKSSVGVVLETTVESDDSDDEPQLCTICTDGEECIAKK